MTVAQQQTPTPRSSSAPAWLHALTTQKFFTPCKGAHPPKAGGRDTLLTFFDLETLSAYCHFCRASRLGSRCELQIRRSTYHEVCKLADVAALTDVAGVQSYVINGDKVVFLQPRPQPRPPKGCAFPATCLSCNRHLMDAGNTYCSLRCKLDHEDAGAVIPSAGASREGMHCVQTSYKVSYNGGSNSAAAASSHAFSHPHKAGITAAQAAGYPTLQAARAYKVFAPDGSLVSAKAAGAGLDQAHRGAKRTARVLMEPDAKENTAPLRPAKHAKLSAAAIAGGLSLTSMMGGLHESAAMVLGTLDPERGPHQVLHPTAYHTGNYQQQQQHRAHSQGHLRMKAEPSSSGATSSRSQQSSHFVGMGVGGMLEDSPLSLARPYMRQRKHTPHRAPLE